MKTSYFVLALVGFSLAMMAGTAGRCAEKSISLDDDPNYRNFAGLTDTQFNGGRSDLCAALVKRVVRHVGVSFDLPTLNGQAMPKPGGDWTGPKTGEPFEQLMIHAVDPASQDANPYVKITHDPQGHGKSSEQRLEAAILASPDQLSPADVMELALNVTNGNYPLATLTAHNLLKGITYEGRRTRDLLAGVISAQGRQPSPFPKRYGDVAAKLISLRSAPGDKMGIWYHLFAVLSIAAWIDPDTAYAAIRSEYFVRSLKGLTNMGSPVDDEKKASDYCFQEAADEIFMFSVKQADGGGLLDRNLIVNGDAEQGEAAPDNNAIIAPPGWTKEGNFTVIKYGASGGFPDASSPGPDERGSNFFVGGPDNDHSSASQDVNVAALASNIDAGEVSYSFSAYLGGYAGQEDCTTLTASFLNSGGSELGTAVLGPVSAGDRSSNTGLVKRETRGTVPPSTRTIRIKLAMQRYQGSYNDGSADNLVLTLHAK